MDKREANRKFEGLELTNQQLIERLSAAEARAEELERENENLRQTVLTIQCGQRQRAMLNTTGFPAPEATKSKRLQIIKDTEMVDLESDGIKLIDFDRQMMKLD